jgi:hypothetical protein
MGHNAAKQAVKNQYNCTLLPIPVNFDDYFVKLLMKSVENSKDLASL